MSTLISLLDAEIKNAAYHFNGKALGIVPENLAYLFPAIDKSKFILHLQDNWDDEGSEGYQETTWTAAIQFLTNYARTLFEDFNIEIVSPKIHPGPKGSIDILWETDDYRLVVNVAKSGDYAMFYADNYKDQTSEGVFKLSEFNRYLLPIAMQQL